MSTRQVKRAFKFRCYPDAEQAALLSRTFGCTRFVYNAALAARTAAWRDDHKRLSYVDTSALLTQWKREPGLEFLSEVSSVPLQQALRHLNTAFMNFWNKQAAYPTYKAKKRCRDSAEFTYRAFSWREATEDRGPSITLAKTGAPLNVVFHRQVPAGTPSTATVTRDGAGRWFISLLFTDTITPLPAPTHEVIGVDMGQMDTVTTVTRDADGGVVATKTPGLMPRRSLQDKLARAQRLAARKTKGSKNRAKAQQKVARLHAKIADARRDHLHKTSLRLIRENQAIGIEDLDVRGMTASARGSVEAPGTGVKKKSASNRNNLDVGYRMLRTMIEYKADWYGRDVVSIDRYYPSTRLCSTTGCAHIHRRLPTQIRVWTCPGCGTTHDRDINAATNIQAAATAVIACGDGVRLRGHTSSQRAAVAEAGSLEERSSKPGPSGPGS